MADAQPRGGEPVLGPVFWPSGPVSPLSLLSSLGEGVAGGVAYATVLQHLGGLGVAGPRKSFV